MVMLLEQVFQATERESASSVAYDTPSPKLLAFLKKHYGALPFRKLRSVAHWSFSIMPRYPDHHCNFEDFGAACSVHFKKPLEACTGLPLHAIIR